MISFRSRRTVLILTIAAVLCSAALLAAGLSGRLDLEKVIGGVKYIAKVMLRGHVDPAKLDTGLPVIKINTHNGKAVTSRENYTTTDIEIIDPNNSGNNLKTDVEIRGRGNTTWNSLKKPYRLRFSKKTSLFGYEKAKSWVLLANYQDPTLIMNSAAFELGRRFGLPFTPHYTHVEVILNGRYEGSYIVTEQIQTGAGRVDIQDNGFFVELDTHYDEEPKFRTGTLGMPVVIKHPEDLPDDSGYDFVRDALNELEEALFADTFPDSGWRELLDLDTWIDYIMINEITRNVDLQFPHSVYLYRDGKEGALIGAGPLWDFDWGFDYTNGRYFNETTGMYYHTAFRDGPGRIFFARFFEDPVFRERYKERWNEMYQEIAGMEMFMDEMAALLDKSQEANFKVWQWKKYGYRKEIERMKTWWRERIEYLNTEINRMGNR
jgi:spore coat protein CotH